MIRECEGLQVGLTEKPAVRNMDGVQRAHASCVLHAAPRCVVLACQAMSPYDAHGRVRRGVSNIMRGCLGMRTKTSSQALVSNTLNSAADDLHVLSALHTIRLLRKGCVPSLPLTW